MFTSELAEVSTSRLPEAVTSGLSEAFFSGLVKVVISRLPMRKVAYSYSCIFIGLSIHRVAYS